MATKQTLAALVAVCVIGAAGVVQAQQPRAPTQAPTGVRAAAPAPGDVDLSSLAKGYELATKGVPVAADGPALFVFISFSMPQASLARLVEQAEASGAVLVLRGLENGSMTATAKRIKDLIGERNVEFNIDPLAFDRYGVRAVPTFVLTAGGPTPSPCSGAQCFTSAQYASVSGDVTIGYALDQMERRAPRWRSFAQGLRRKIGG